MYSAFPVDALASGDPETNEQIESLFVSLTGADRITSLRRTSHDSWEAICYKNGEKLGAFALIRD